MLVDTLIAEMKNVRTLRKRRAVSPVIATVILVAITITVAVAVSYWMSGIAGQYTSFEKVEIQSGHATIGTTPVGWYVTIDLKNTGTATATLTKVFINEVPVLEYGITLGTAGVLAGIPVGPPIVAAADSSGTSIPTPDGLPIMSGAAVTVYVYIGDTYAFLSPGTTINIKLHSAGGMDYIRLIQLN